MLFAFIFCVVLYFMLPSDKREEKDTYIDNSVHHHYYDNRSVHLDGNTTTIDNNN